MTRDPRKLLVLLLTYGDASPALEVLRRILEQLPWSIRFLLIRNDHPELQERAVDSLTFEIGGDNTVFEFSGWQKGLESQVAEKFSPDLILLANDAFVANGLASIPAFDADTLEYLVGSNGVGGRVRTLPCSARYQDYEIQEYLQTHLFIVHPEMPRRLGSLVSEASADRFVKPYFSRDWFTDHEIWSPPFREYTFHVLTQRWHGTGKRNSPENYEFFKRKILCIVNELALSARLENHPVSDLTPLPWVLDSSLVIDFPGRPFVPFQAARNLLFGLLSLLFFNRPALRVGLDHKFRSFCAKVSNRRLR